MTRVHRSLEKIQSHQGGFAALPGYRDFRCSLRFDHLPDIGFEHIVAHAKATVRIEFLLGEEKAVGAIQVACCAGWFAQDMKGGWCVLRPGSRQSRHGLRSCLCLYHRDDLRCVHTCAFHCCFHSASLSRTRLCYWCTGFGAKMHHSNALFLSTF